MLTIISQCHMNSLEAIVVFNDKYLIMVHLGMSLKFTTFMQGSLGLPMQPAHGTLCITKKGAPLIVSLWIER